MIWRCLAVIGRKAWSCCGMQQLLFMSYQNSTTWSISVISSSVSLRAAMLVFPAGSRSTAVPGTMSLLSFALKSCWYAASKGNTIRQLLDENGFDTSYIKKDTYIITEKAFSVCYSSIFNGLEDRSDTIFRGISIDAELKPDKKGKVSDEEVKFWKIGWQGVRTCFSGTTKRWNSSFDGNCCRFNIVWSEREIQIYSKIKSRQILNMQKRSLL